MIEESRKVYNHEHSCLPGPACGDMIVPIHLPGHSLLRRLLQPFIPIHVNCTYAQAHVSTFHYPLTANGFKSLETRVRILWESYLLLLSSVSCKMGIMKPNVRSPVSGTQSVLQSWKPSLAVSFSLEYLTVLIAK